MKERQLWELQLLKWFRIGNSFDSFADLFFFTSSLFLIFLSLLYLPTYLFLHLLLLQTTQFLESVYRKVEVKRSTTKLTGNLESCLKLVTAATAAGYIRNWLLLHQLLKWLKVMNFRPADQLNPLPQSASSLLSRRDETSKRLLFLKFIYYIKITSTIQHVDIGPNLLLASFLNFF